MMRLFRTPFDQLNLAIPAVFLTFAVVEYFSGSHALWQYQNFLKYMQDLLFFNGLHVCLTFVYLTTTATGREAVSLFVKKTGRFGLARIVFVFFGSAFVYYVVHAKYGKGTIAIVLFYIALTAIRRRHDLGQSKGLLRIANREFVRANREWENDPRFKQIQIFEHHLINTFYFTSLVAILTYFDHGGMTLGAWSKTVFQISFWSSILIAGGITACALMSPKGTKLWKALYSIRFYLKVISPYSAIVAYAGASVHGTEYVMITDKIIQSEKKQKRLVTSIITLSFIIFGAFLAYVFFRYPNFFIPSISRGDSIPILSLAVGIIITHYHVDHLIFTPKYDFAKPLLRVLSEPIHPTVAGTRDELKVADSRGR